LAEDPNIFLIRTLLRQNVTCATARGAVDGRYMDRHKCRQVQNRFKMYKYRRIAQSENGLINMKIT